MEEVVLATFNNVKFIEGVSKMTQENWQSYFSSVIPNGVYSGLEPRNYIGTTQYSSGNIFITDGEVFANGIYAKITTPEGYTDIGVVPASITTIRDRFICIRVYFDTEQAELIAKYNIAPEADTSSSAPELYQSQDWLFQIQGRYFVDDESYCCERTSRYWELPIFYQSTRFLPWSSYESAYSRGIDLRRMITLNKTKIFNENMPGLLPETSGYFISGDNKIDLYYGYIFSNPVNPPDNATFYCDGSYHNDHVYLVKSLNVNNSYLLRNYQDYPLEKFDQINNFIGDFDGTDMDSVYITTSSTPRIFRLTHLYDKYTNYPFPSPYESFNNVLLSRNFLFEEL